MAISFFIKINHNVGTCGGSVTHDDSSFVCVSILSLHSGCLPSSDQFFDLKKIAISCPIELVLYHPDGGRFPEFEEIAHKLAQERQRADQAEQTQNETIPR
jgi:hypothetical protein